MRRDITELREKEKKRGFLANWLGLSALFVGVFAMLGLGGLVVFCATKWSLDPAITVFTNPTSWAVMRGGAALILVIAAFITIADEGD